MKHSLRYLFAYFFRTLLKGYNGNRTADFREQIGIYILSDKDYAPLYIGQAGQGQRRLLNRLNQHETDHLWNRWEHFSWFGFRKVNRNGTLSLHDDITKLFRAPGSKLLDEVEGALITALEPKLNKQGARWQDVEEYYQYVDDEMEDVTTLDLSKRFDRVEKLLERLCDGPSR